MGEYRTFKDFMHADIGNTFENLTEFAETAMINGTAVNIVEDNDKLIYRITQNYDGLVIGDILFYISAEEYAKIPALLPGKPTANQALKYKGRPATITNVTAEAGMYEIILQMAGGY